jgi:hypothetical protein
LEKGRVFAFLGKRSDYIQGNTYQPDSVSSKGQNFIPGAFSDGQPQTTAKLVALFLPVAKQFAQVRIKAAAKRCHIVDLGNRLSPHVRVELQIQDNP